MIEVFVICGVCDCGYGCWIVVIVICGVCDCKYGCWIEVIVICGVCERGNGCCIEVRVGILGMLFIGIWLFEMLGLGIIWRGVGKI